SANVSICGSSAFFDWSLMSPLPSDKARTHCAFFSAPSLVAAILFWATALFSITHRRRTPFSFVSWSVFCPCSEKLCHRIDGNEAASSKLSTLADTHQAPPPSPFSLVPKGPRTAKNRILLAYGGQGCEFGAKPWLIGDFNEFDGFHFDFFTSQCLCIFSMKC